MLLILLVACTEEPCRGNETNDQVAEKQIVKYPGGNLNWSRYHKYFMSCSCFKKVLMIVLTGDRDCDCKGQIVVLMLGV